MDHFRLWLSQLRGHYCTGSACVFCSLHQLFAQLSASNRAALPADQLRRALAHTFSAQRRFQLGLMDDAIECFEHILQRLHLHCAGDQPDEGCQATHCVAHRLFAHQLIERRRCGGCNRGDSRPPYAQFVQYVSTPALLGSALNARRANPLSFGSLVRAVCAQGDFRDCAFPECGSRCQLRKTLLNAPPLLAIGLNWESERPSAGHIAQLLQLVEIQLRLSDVSFFGFLKNRIKFIYRIQYKHIGSRY